MIYPNYLSAGIAYDEESNYYNAYESYQLALSNNTVYLELNNYAVTLSNLGLQRLAFSVLNKSTRYYDFGRYGRVARPSHLQIPIGDYPG